MNFTTEVEAILSGVDLVTEITGLPFEPYLVDVDSQGNIFVSGENDVWKSTDQGSTWTKVLDGATTTNRPYVLFVDSNDYIHAQIWETGGIYYIYRSIDNGNTWTVINDTMIFLWHMAEDRSGTSTDGYLYVNTYSTGNPIIYRSTDQGGSWHVWANFSDIGTFGTPTPNHVHAIGVDRLGQVWTGSGDGTNSRVDRWNGTAWEKLANGTGTQPTAFYFDNDFAYLLPDAYFETWRIPFQGIWSDRREVFNIAPYEVSKGGNNWIFDGQNINDANDVWLFGTERGQIWGTWDNNHFVKIWSSSTIGSIFRISQRSPIYFIDRLNSKLYRADITKEDLVRVYHVKFNEKRASVTNAENYVIEQRIHNGTQMIDLTGVALSDAQASLIGLRRETAYTPYGNSGFEWNNKTGWTENAYPAGVITTEDNPPEDSYSYRVNKSEADSFATSLRNSSTTYPMMFRGDTLVMSAYVKANVSVPAGMNFYLIKMDPYTNLQQSDIDVTTEWTRVFKYYTLGGSHDYENAEMRIVINFQKKNATFYLDAVHFEILDVGIEFNNGTNEDSIAYLEEHRLIDYFDSQNETQNPNITINGQTVSHSGELTNGTESSATSLSGILTGAIRVDANISGSKQAILRITGTRLLNVTNATIQGRTGNVTYGRYYSAPAINATSMIVLANKEANITSLSYANSRLNFTVNSSNNTNSSTKVYWPYTFAPRKVVCTASAYNWSHNLTTNITTLNATHSSDVNWTLYVQLSDGESCTASNECINGYCIHGICRSTSFYCGDSYCDSGETCGTCSNDCGSCPSFGSGCVIENQFCYSNSSCCSGLYCENNRCKIIPSAQAENITTLECPVCQSPTEWSNCTNNTQRRTNYRCSQETNYECQPYEETRYCGEMKPDYNIPILITSVALILLIIFMIVFRIPFY